MAICCIHLWRYRQQRHVSYRRDFWILWWKCIPKGTSGKNPMLIWPLHFCYNNFDWNWLWPYYIHIFFQKQAKYFSFDDGSWIETLTNNTKIKIGGITLGIAGDKFHGSVSCLQIYNVPLNEAEMINKTKCLDLPGITISSPCPQDFNPYQDKCLKVTHIIQIHLYLRHF